MVSALLKTLSQPNTALISHPHEKSWWLFSNPLACLEAHTIEEVLPLIVEVEQRTQQNSAYAVGFIAYEAARAFDPAFHTHPLGSAPLVWFGLYDAPRLVTTTERPSPPLAPPAFESDTSSSEYRRAISRIREHIAAGDTYQVNFTIRLRAFWPENPFAIFLALYQTQPSPFAAFLNLPDLAVCSVSPELFFDLNETTLVCRPMKGTRARGCRHDEDERIRQELHMSRKDRAENLMILDMMRNDLGRIALPGSVHVQSLFDVERHPTVWQMTSAVTAQTQAPIVEIFRALFPCASVTGAPKVRTTQIIAELEKSPRGIYTGAIGFVAPARRARFSVAIRTLVVNRHSCAEYGTGGGIVWDSKPENEYAEAITKARILFEDPSEFELFETILWHPKGGFFFDDLHIKRIASSANYFGFPFDEGAARYALRHVLTVHPSGHAYCIRLLLDRNGTFRTETRSVSHPFHDHPTSNIPIRTVTIAGEPVSSSNRFLYHKTTRRQIYEKAKTGMVTDDVLLWNENGHVTESTIANIVAVFDSEWVTPPVSDGLLPGVFREHLLQAGRLRERSIPLDSLFRADSVYLVNSVRGWVRCKLEKTS